MKTINRLAIALFIFGLVYAPSPAQAQAEAPIIPRSVIFSDTDKFGVRISPDGTKISYISAADGTLNLMIGPVSDPSQAKPVTKPEDTPAGNYQWAYTGHHLVYVKRAGKGAHLFALDLRDGQTRDLTPIEDVSARYERLSPDLPEEVLISLNNRDPKQHDLYRINILTGKMELVLKNEGFDTILSDDLFRPRVAGRNTDEGGFEFFRLSDKGEWQSLLKLNYEQARYARPIALDKNGGTLYMVDNLTTDTASLKAVNLQTGKARLLVTDPLADIVPVLMIHPATSRVQSATSAYGRTRRHFLDKSIAPDFKYLSGLRDGDVGIAGRSLDDRMWLVAYLDGGPLRYYAYDRKAKRAWPLFTDLSALDEYPLARRHAAVITARDGLKLPADLYLPSWTKSRGSRLAEKPLPMLVYVHGGPSVAYPWNSWFTNRVLQLLANRGYAVLRIEFRGADGFGQKVLFAGAKEWGGKMHQDVLDAVEWAVKQGVAERNRVGIFGWSYGGYSTLAALTFTPEAFACGMAMYPISDLNAMMDTRNPLHFRRFWRKLVGDESNEEGRAFLKSRSPLHFVQNIKRPLLVTHGANDTAAPPSHSDEFVAEMKKHNKPVTYLFYPDEGHDYRRKENWASLFAAAERFFHQRLGGRYEPVGNDMIGSSIEVKEGGDLIPGFAEARGEKKGAKSGG